MARPAPITSPRNFALEYIHLGGSRVRRVVAFAGVATLATLMAAPATAGGLLIERSLSRMLGLQTGDSVFVSVTGEIADGVPFAIAGVLDETPDPSRLSAEDKHIVLSLPALEELTGERDRLTRVVVKLAPGADPHAAANGLNARSFGYHAHAATDLARESSQVFVVVSNFHKAISVLSVLAGAMFLAAIVLLQIQELQKTLGVLRLIGISRFRITAVVIGETIVLANVGSVIGVGLAYVASAIVNRYYRFYFDTQLVFSSIQPGHVWIACTISTAVGIIVGTLATIYLFKLRMTEVLGR